MRSSSASGLLRSWRAGPDVNMNFISPAAGRGAGGPEPPVVDTGDEESEDINWSGQL